MRITTVYLTDELKNRIDILASETGKTKAQITREALKRGLAIQGKSYAAKGLLKLAKLKGKGPKDLSERHDYYLWED